MNNNDGRARDPEGENINLRGLLLAIGLWLVAIALMWLGDKGIPDLLIGVGGGLVSSVAVVFMYSRFAEEISLARISERSAKIATKVANEFLVKRFEQTMPAKTYERTSAPTIEFRDDFVSRLRDSKIYLHRGDGNFVTFRLFCCAANEAIKSKVQVSLCILDPTADLVVQQRARIELDTKGTQHSNEELSQQVSRILMSIFQSLMALFDIRHTRSVEVFLHRESSFYRSEILDGSLFITYYIGGEFPGTYLYSSQSYVYQAFLHGFKAATTCASMRINFDSRLTEAEFIDKLRGLGCTTSLEELRLSRDESYAIRKTSLPFLATELF